MAKKLNADCFNIVNYNQQQVLFRTEDPIVNKFTFTIINNTGADLALTGSGDGTASCFNFNFESMLTTEVVEHMAITLPETWQKDFQYAFETPSWSVYPMENMLLKPGEYVQFQLTNITCADTAPGNFYITYNNIPDYGSSEFPVSKHLNVINPPDPAKKTLPLQGAYTSVVHPVQGQSTPEGSEEEMIRDGEAVPIYITYDQVALIENGFTYLLTNTSKDPLVPVAEQLSDLAAANPPTLYISFSFGNEDYDITTQELADNTISIDVIAGLPWMPVKHTEGTSYWQFMPGSGQIMNGKETVKFPIHKIITALNVPAETTSILYVQLNNIPGYNDATYTILMHKLIANAKIDSFSADRYLIYIGENVSVSWESSLAKRVTLEYYLKDNKQILLDSAKGEIKLSAKDFFLPVPPTAEPTSIIVTAYDDSGKDSRHLSIVVSEWPQAEIVYFRAGEWLAEGTEQIEGNTYADFLLTWDTKYADKVVISYTWGDSREFPATTKSTSIGVNVSLHSWVDFTLSAYSHNKNYPNPIRQTIQLRNLNRGLVNTL